MNTPLNATAVCPFYLYDSGSGAAYITCEGIYGSSTRNIFKRAADKTAHAETYCTTKNCKNCEIYKLNMKKYEESTDVNDSPQL